MDNPIWSILDVDPIDEFEMESGQLVINKRKAWHALNLCEYLNQDFYMRLINGDKDTFRLAWYATKTPFYKIPTRVNPVGMMSPKGTFCGLRFRNVQR